MNVPQTFVVRALYFVTYAPLFEARVPYLVACGILVTTPSHAMTVTNMPHATKCGARATKCGAHAIKSCGTCHEIMGNMPQIGVVDVIKGCHNFSGHVPQLFGACATTFRSMRHNFSGHGGMCHNFLWQVPQLVEACATTFRGICHYFSGHFLRHVHHILLHIGHSPSSYTIPVCGMLAVHWLLVV